MLKPVHAVTVVVLNLLMASVASAAVTEQLVDLTKPNGTTLRYLSSIDTAASGVPEVGVILFSGSQGQVNLVAGIPQPGANFLVRTRQYFA